jgi:hypothetical protein
MCIGIAAITAACSKILIGYIVPHITIVIVLGTAAVYWFDDIIDRAKDEKRFTVLIQMKSIRKWIFTIMIPIVLFLSIYLNKAGLNFFLFLCFLGIISGIFSHLPVIKKYLYSLRLCYLYKTIFESFIWTTVSVLTPIIYTHNEINPQLFIAFIFVWLQLSTIILTWLIADRNVFNTSNEIILEDNCAEKNILSGLRLVCVLSGILSIIANIIGFFPWYNIAVIIHPAVNWLFLKRWRRVNFDKRVYVDIMLISNLVCCFVVILIDDIYSGSRPSEANALCLSQPIV